MIFGFHILPIVLILIAGMAKGFRDLVSFHWGKAPKWMKKREKFWRVIPNKTIDPKNSERFAFLIDFDYEPKSLWTNKYKNDDKNQGEKFWGSSTIFVAFTDGWHLMELILKIGFIGAIITYPGSDGLLFNTPVIRMILDSVLLYLAFQGGFKLTYK